MRFQTILCRVWPLATWTLLSAVLPGSVGCSSSPSGSQSRVLLAVSIHPLVSLVRNVAGDEADILCLIPQGASPHTYEPTPSQIARLSRAKALFVIGLGLEYWSEDLVGAVGDQGLKVVETSSGIEPIDKNPHVWLDPMNAVVQVETIRDTLVRVDPDEAEKYRSRAEQYVDKLESLHQEIETEVSGWSQRAFVAFHPTWSYFARRYHLEEAAVIEPAPGREPSVAHLSRIIETIRRRGLRAVVAEPQLPARLAETLAVETGTEVVVLDPLGGNVAPDEYEALLRYNVQALSRVMK